MFIPSDEIETTATAGGSVFGSASLSINICDEYPANKPAKIIAYYIDEEAASILFYNVNLVYYAHQ